MTGRFQQAAHSATLWQAVGDAIQARTGFEGTARPRGRVTGGDINQAVEVEFGQHRYFVKLNRPERLAMFEAEAAGLSDLAAARAIRCPAAIATGLNEQAAFLVLEFLPLGGRGSAGELGEQLARMHRSTAERYGWDRDNTIGSTPQPNGWSGDWVEFLRHRRLGHQLQLAEQNGFGGRLLRQGERLLEELPVFFTSYTPTASLLHGDLWGGNHGYLEDGTPVIFDPAVYYGDRETDLAMTELFGGFGAGFHAAYQACWPLNPGYPVRKQLYQLYHVLNHANLFGGGYAAQAERLIDSLLADIR